jgi:hypothetical protein
MPLAQAMRVQPTCAKLKHQKPDRTLPPCSRSSSALSFTKSLALVGRLQAWWLQCTQHACAHAHVSLTQTTGSTCSP